MKDFKTFIKNVSDPWFTCIATGLKTVEGRLNTDSFQQINVGDYIVFNNDQLGFIRSCKIKVVNKVLYKSFAEYLLTEKLEKCLPSVSNIDDGQKVYYKFYKKEDEEKLGVLAIHLDLVS